MLFKPQTGEQIFRRINYVPDRPHDDWEDVSVWPSSEDDSGAIRGYLDSNEPREHFSFAHHVAVLEQEQIDYADDAYERWLAHTSHRKKLMKSKVVKKYGPKNSDAVQHLKQGDFDECLKNSGHGDKSGSQKRNETDIKPMPGVPASQVSSRVDEKIQYIKDAFSMFRDGAITVNEFKELKHQILSS